MTESASTGGSPAPDRPAIHPSPTDPADPLDLRILTFAHAGLGALTLVFSGVLALANLYRGERYWAMPMPGFVLASFACFLLYTGLVLRLEAVRVGEQVLLLTGASALTVAGIADLAAGTSDRPHKIGIGLVVVWFLAVRAVRTLRSPAVRNCFARPSGPPARQVEGEVRDAFRTVMGAAALYTLVVGLTLGYGYAATVMLQPRLHAPVWHVVAFFVATLVGSLAAGLVTAVVLLHGVTAAARRWRRPPV